MRGNSDEKSKFDKEVLIDDIPIKAMLDNGSDITIIRADEFVKLGAPRFQNNVITFRGVGTETNTTLGEFQASLTIDGHSYPILIRIVSDDLLQQKLLIGRDFIHTVDLTIKRGKATVSPSSDTLSESDSVRPEIYEINLIENQCVNLVDLPDDRSNQYREAVQKLVDNYHPVKTRELGIKMTIVLKDDEPVYQRARPLAPHEREEVNSQINKWIEDEIVRPSISDYASPVLLTTKKDGSKRLCVDYRLLNRNVIKDRYPLPLIEDQLDKLQGARVFSTLDLKNGFLHVPIDESSQKYTAFIVSDGHF